MVAPSANRLLVLACVSPGTQGQKMISKPHRIFAENLEQTALDQFESAMEQPFAVKGVLLPDAHTGYSLPIGAVVATDGVVLPSWVVLPVDGLCVQVYRKRTP